jgi:hypothetical protein
MHQSLSRRGCPTGPELCRWPGAARRGLAGVLGLRTATVPDTTVHTSGHWARYRADRQPAGSTQPQASRDFE